MIVFVNLVFLIGVALIGWGLTYNPEKKEVKVTKEDYIAAGIEVIIIGIVGLMMLLMFSEVYT